MRQTRRISYAFAGLIVLATGCPSQPQGPTDVGGDDTGGGLDAGVVPDATADVGDQDGDAGEEADADSGPACEPLTECPVDACGELDDGCGGTLDCGVCDCVDGEPTSPTCGPCGLGAPACDAQGTLSCTLPAVPDLEGLTCEGIIYVDLGAAGGLEDGTRLDPYVTLSDALTEAKANPAKRLIVATQEGPLEEGFLRIHDGVSIVGGYTRAWLYTMEKTRVVAGGADPSTVGNEQYKAMAIADTTEPMLLEGLIVEMRDASGQGANAIGLSIDSAAGSVRIDRFELTAGRGGAGRAGSQGARGDDGTVGVDAHPTVFPDFAAFRGENPFALADCPDAIGGDGGWGGVPDSLVGGDLAAQPQDGDPSPLGTPGGQSSVNRARNAGGDGGAGAAGEDGLDGVLPEPFGPDRRPIYTIESFPGLGVDFDGMDGGQGSVGSPGAGGGGGGGASRFTAPDASGTDRVYGGGSGGAGGHGGCGGEGGTGGQGGGSSVGLLVSNSPDVTIERSVISGGIGGAGGTGGPGGDGGDGGDGGAGTSTNTVTGAPLLERGGAGGDGGPGGKGGDGAGGAGGHSIGALCDAPIVVDRESIIRAGVGGDGGRGIQASPDGETVDRLGCQ